VKFYTIQWGRPFGRDPDATRYLDRYEAELVLADMCDCTTDAQRQRARDCLASIGVDAASETPKELGL
jgi:hypothetical protein